MPLSPFPIRNQVGSKQSVMPHTGFSPVAAGIHRPRPFASGGSPTTTLPGIKFNQLTRDDVAKNLSPQVLSSLQKSVPSGFTPPSPSTQGASVPQRKPMVPQSVNTGPMYGGFASGGAPTIAANSSVPALTSDEINAYPTLGAAAPISSIAQTPQPYSSYATSVPLSSLTGGAGSNGIVAPVNSMGMAQGSPAAPTTTAQSSLVSAANIGANATPSVAAPISIPLASENTTDPFSQFYTFKKGGATHLADGGFPSSSEAAPWFARAEARGSDSPIHAGGILPGNTGGRSDVLNKIVPAGSYVLPADVVSGLGEGNTNAGAHVMDMMMHTLPYGISGGGGRKGGMGIPRAPAAYKPPAPLNLNQVSRGGTPKGDTGSGPVPVVLASGEYLVPREKVMALGNGNLKAGHKILDAFVLHVRNKTAKTLKSLPGPKK